MINVTKTFLPPLGEYEKLLERIWKNEWITNRGELVLELEEKLKRHLNVPNIIIMTNGTLPIQIALKLLGKAGEIITTPFSYVATTSSIVWENCTPVFVDIHPEYLTINEEEIEAAITTNTTAILATHVFGNPCNVEAIESIASKYGLSVIYDAAHSFGVTYKGKSIMEYGDISTCSFHATKLFHTGEGGAVFTNDDALLHRIFYSHNFGHNGALAFHGLGINAKMSELQAAMGLAVFPHITEIISERKKIVDYYNQQLSFKNFRTQKLRPETEWNYCYYPIIFESEKLLLKVLDKLSAQQIFPRRYFYPSLNTLDYLPIRQMITAEAIASQIICLPLYLGLEPTDLEKIVSIINEVTIETVTKC